MQQNRDNTGSRRGSRQAVRDTRGDDYLDPDKTPFAEPLRCGTSPLEGDAAIVRQVEACKAAWEKNQEPLALAKAVDLVRGMGWIIPGWLSEGLTAFILARRTDDEAQFHRKQMRHAVRYLAVRDFRRHGFTKDEAIDRAVQKLEGDRRSAARPSVVKSYAKVRSDLKNDRALGEYFPADEDDE